MKLIKYSLLNSLFIFILYFIFFSFFIIVFIFLH